MFYHLEGKEDRVGVEGEKVPSENRSVRQLQKTGMAVKTSTVSEYSLLLILPICGSHLRTLR